MARYSKIISSNRRSHKAGRSLALGSFRIRRNRLLSYVLQMGDLFAAETVFNEDLLKIIRHVFGR